jgi:hypothetical protein
MYEVRGMEFDVGSSMYEVRCMKSIDREESSIE